MSWDNATLTILATFGCGTLLLSQITEVLSKLPEVIRAWHDVRRALRAGPDTPLGEEAPEEVGESNGNTG
ncbi:hypothetical protein [Streptomyces cucumeris]|uniref:hypothetical protein n=1 Tax=Streptomyces cucumeris TaxID=2962890 RepID=UPI003EB9CAF0